MAFLEKEDKRKRETNTGRRTSLSFVCSVFFFCFKKTNGVEDWEVIGRCNGRKQMWYPLKPSSWSWDATLNSQPTSPSPWGLYAGWNHLPDQARKVWDCNPASNLSLATYISQWIPNYYTNRWSVNTPLAENGRGRWHSSQGIIIFPLSIPV